MLRKNGNYIYRAEGWENIVYQNKNTEAPEFNLSKKVYGLTAKVQVTNIEFKGNVGKGTLSYCLFNNETEGNWKTVATQEFTVEQSGIYKVRLTDGAGNVTEKTVEVVLANKPKLDSGMTPVVYDSTLGKWKKVSEDSGEWYDYASDKKQWANVMLQDGLVVNEDGTIDNDKMGSMFVWVPRYMYQISAENYHTSTAGEIQIKFLKGTTNIATDGTNVIIANASGGDNWNVHPAFCDGTKNNYANGEWDKDITGIWVAKFEASSSDNTAEYGGGDTVELNVKVLPSVPSWRNISVNNIYEVCKNITNSGNIYGLKINTDSHMMKNSEWGAVVYLSQSKYGINAQIWNNPSWNTDTVITGQTAAIEGGESAGPYVPCNNYNEGYGVNGSTTRNIYGIYDMAGGSWEFVAAHLEFYDIMNTDGMDNLIFAEPKYKNVYKICSNNDYYEFNADIYGDAIYETPSWYQDLLYYPYQGDPVFVRSGSFPYGTNSGSFFIGCVTPVYDADGSFRPVFIVE